MPIATPVAPIPVSNVKNQSHQDQGTLRFKGRTFATLVGKKNIWKNVTHVKKCLKIQFTQTLIIKNTVQAVLMKNLKFAQYVVTH